MSKLSFSSTPIKTAAAPKETAPTTPPQTEAPKVKRAVRTAAPKPAPAPAPKKVVAEFVVDDQESFDNAAPPAEQEQYEVPARVQGPTEFLEDSPDSVGMDEVQIPRINLVQKSGDLADQFTPGDLLLNKELVLFSVPEKDADAVPLIVTFLQFQPLAYVERVSGGGELGRFARSLEDVAKFGGTVNYQQWKNSGEKIPFFQPMSTALVAIQAPDDLDEDATSYFPYEFEGKQYAIALWSMKGGCYTHGAKTVKTALKLGHLRKGGLKSYCYAMTFTLKKYGTGNSSYIPVLKNGGKNSDELIAAFREVTGESPAASAE